MRIAIFLFALLITSMSYAQLDGNTKAKLYFTEAEKYFNQNDYEQAIEYVEKAEEALGSTNSRILNLKVKSAYNSGEFIKAKYSLDVFINDHQDYATEEIKNETLSYFVRIEKALGNRIMIHKNEGLFLTERNDEWGFIDIKGETIIPFGKYDYAYHFSDGLAAVEKNNKWGFIDTNGKLVIPFQFSFREFESFVEGLAQVKKDDKWGYMDKTGKIIIPCKYDKTNDFSNGTAVVKLYGKLFLINKKGECVKGCN